MKVASKKFLLFEIQFNPIICVCFVHIEIMQVKQSETLLWGLAQVIINCIHYF
jgi:hypothetical protein